MPLHRFWNKGEAHTNTNKVFFFLISVGYYIAYIYFLRIPYPFLLHTVPVRCLSSLSENLNIVVNVCAKFWGFFSPPWNSSIFYIMAAVLRLFKSFNSNVLKSPDGTKHAFVKIHLHYTDVSVKSCTLMLIQWPLQKNKYSTCLSLHPEKRQHLPTNTLKKNPKQKCF